MDVMICPVCGSVLYVDDTIYKNDENEFVGCQNCISARSAYELSLENYD